MFILMFGYPIMTILVIFFYKSRLEQPQIYKRISNFYTDIKLNRRRDVHLAYYTIFLIRRIIFVSIPTFFYMFPFYQVQILIFLTSLYIIFYAGSKPHIYKSRRWIEVFNEVWIMMMNYHLIAFSDFNRSNLTQYLAGYSYIFNIGFIVAVNLVVMIYKMIQKFIRLRKLKMMRDTFLRQRVVDETPTKKKTIMNREMILEHYETMI
jgi:hypothetical protein